MSVTSRAFRRSSRPIRPIGVCDEHFCRATTNRRSGSDERVNGFRPLVGLLT